MASVTKIEEIKRKPGRKRYLGYTNLLIIHLRLVKQLITPKPCPQRGKPFPLSGNEEWFIYPHGKTVYLYNLKDPRVRAVIAEEGVNLIFPMVEEQGVQGTRLCSWCSQTVPLRYFNSFR